MPRLRHAHAVRLEFEPGPLIHTNLSGAVFTGEWLWVAGDEACQLERLQKLDRTGREMLRFGASTTFRLADLLDLPAGPEDEADLEGMGLSEGCLWVVGSHGLKRKNAKPGKRDHEENGKRLAKLSLDGNRRLLACLPFEPDAEGRPTLVRETRDGRRARRLEGDAHRNQLTDLLKDDPHFGPYMSIPGKDNGFDIEGLAVDGKRLLLGLRGPVLRGWSGLLEIAVEPHKDGLRLVPLDAQGTMLRKHFLDLEGLGVRDLHFHGDDLYFLAGPTMVLDGEIRVFRWPNAKPLLAANREPVRFEKDALETSIELPHGRGLNRAEALCDLPPELSGSKPGWLVLYDAPGPDRKDGEHTVLGDLLRHA